MTERRTTRGHGGTRGRTERTGWFAPCDARCLTVGRARSARGEEGASGQTQATPAFSRGLYTGGKTNSRGISAFTMQGGAPALVPLGRNFAIDPTGRLLFAANQNSATVRIFTIDQTTGQLKPSGAPVEVPSPVRVRFLPPRTGG